MSLQSHIHFMSTASLKDNRIAQHLGRYEIPSFRRVQHFKRVTVLDRKVNYLRDRHERDAKNAEDWRLILYHRKNRWVMLAIGMAAATFGILRAFSYPIKK